jgi:hypothetical protein
VPVGGKIRTKLGLAEATGGDEARLGMGSRGARGCVEAVEVWQGEGERCGVGRATRNVIDIYRHAMSSKWEGSLFKL